VVSARATIVDLRGRSKMVEVPCVFVHCRTRRPIVHRVLGSGRPLVRRLPRRSAVLLTSAACDEKDDLVQGFCELRRSDGLRFQSDVERSIQLQKIYPELRIVVCSPQADLLPTSEFIQVSRGLRDISEIDDLLTHASRPSATTALGF